MANRIPYNIAFCRYVKCEYRQGNKCSQPECIREGSDKWAAYWTEYGHLADGDKIDA